MQIPTIKLSEASQATAKAIVKASKSKTNTGQQMQLASYFAFLHSVNNAKTDYADFAKIIMSR